MDDVLLNKKTALERCLIRIREEYLGFESALETNVAKQDSIVLNLERACQLAIDMGIYIVRKNKWGNPQFSRDVFTVLLQKEIISESLSHELKKMVGFRNLAIHEYQNLDLTIIRSIIENKLTVFEDFSKAVFRL